MSATLTEPAKASLKGGEFMVKEVQASETFTPEQFTEEHHMIKDTILDFIQTEILPIYDKIEKQEEGINQMLCKKFGELGFFGTHMPTDLGGMDMDFITNTVIGEVIGGSGSFSVTYNAHTGIGMLPILYYGTDEQKQKYLPALMTGEKMAAYCLTEPGSGSDALSAKTKAILNEAGTHYVINGQKMWITNAGFADIFTVFAQVDGDKFTAFLVERGTPGLSFGEEEKKLGIKGSSTRMVFFEDVKVPVENLLGEVGRGHLIAFNVLNIGRFKLGASTVGSAKAVMNMAIQYANERQQFGKPIASFGAIQHKIADMTTALFIAESALYRCAYQIQEGVKALTAKGVGYEKAKLEAAEEFALECSILKVVGSEALDLVVDENVQIHGGMGFSEEAAAARAFRDARINRIFEGTNEINRMVIMSTIMKRAMKGQVDILTPALAVQSELQNGVAGVETEGDYGLEHKAIKDFKKILLMVLGSAAKANMDGKIDLKREQELLMLTADIIITIYNAESTLLRVINSRKIQHEDLELHEAMLRICLHDAQNQIMKQATDAIAHFVPEHKHGDYIFGIRKYSKYPLQPTIALRRRVAAKQIAGNAYVL